MLSKIKIGDFAKYNNLSIQTLRYYETIGLLSPTYIDPQSRYRYYHINQSAAIDNIQFLKQFNFSLAEIKQIMNEKDALTELSQTIEQKKDELHMKERLIKQQLADIEFFQEGALIYQEKQNQQTLELIHIPDRPILTYSIPKNIYEMTEEEYEFYLRDFKIYLTQQLNYPIDLFNRVGSIMSQDSFIKEEFISKKLFIFTHDRVETDDALVGGLYAVFYCHAFKDELKMLQQLKKELHKQNFQVLGDYICEVVYEQNKTNAVIRKMFIRMQVLVEKISIKKGDD